MREGARGTRCVLCKTRPTHSCAHIPTKQIGFLSGMASKCPDWLIADLCQDCHWEMDEGKYRNDIEIRFKAFALTIERRIDQGILKIDGEEHDWPPWDLM